MGGIGHHEAQDDPKAGDGGCIAETAGARQRTY